MLTSIKKYGYQLFKDKMVTQVVVKADVLKGREKFFLVKSVVHASMKKAHYTVYVHPSLQTWAILDEISRVQTQFSGVHRVQKVSYLNFRVHTHSCLERLRLGALADLFGQNYIYFNLRSLFLFENIKVLLLITR